MIKSEIRILFADDFPLDRLGLKEVIKQAPELKLVAEVGDGQAALEKIRALKPDIAILDIGMPLMDGFAVARAIQDEQLPVEIVFLTAHRKEAFFNEALSVGAKGYLLKDSAISDIVTCIRAVAEGEHFTSPRMTSYLMKRARRDLAPQLPQLEQRKLTDTEKRVLRLKAAFDTNQEIAEKLHISLRTVEAHCRNICQKYGLQGKHALIKFALDHQSELSEDE